MKPLCRKESDIACERKATSLAKGKLTSECTFPDCGCPEARLCMANDPNEGAIALNRPKKIYKIRKKGEK